MHYLWGATTPPAGVVVPSSTHEEHGIGFAGAVAPNAVNQFFQEKKWLTTEDTEATRRKASLYELLLCVLCGEHLL